MRRGRPPRESGHAGENIVGIVYVEKLANRALQGGHAAMGAARSCLAVSSANHRSTRLSHDA